MKLLDAAQAQDSGFDNVETASVNLFLKDKIQDVSKPLWNIVRRLLLLSHGQATVERGFSVNKAVETVNMEGETMIAHRLICDHVNNVGGVDQVSLSKELMMSCSQARTKYRNHLEEERQKKEAEVERQKRKAEEGLRQEAARKRRTLSSVISSLQEEMFKHLSSAEASAGRNMASEVAKANAIAHKLKEI